MTFVGKILVILIMALSLVFLGVSVVAFTTSKNWKDETAKQQEAVNKLKTQLGTETDLKKAAETKLEQAKADHATATKTLETRITTLTQDNEKAQAEITTARTQLTEAQTNANLALGETKAKTDEISKLRDQLTAVTDQANKFKIQQTELNNEILNLKRMLEVADRNTKSLRETAAKFSKLLIDKGFSTDISKVQAVDLPPNVEGKVLKIDDKNRRMEISIGSDDGLSVGQELYLYRTTPTAEYLGKVKISLVEPDQAVATIIGNTVNGKKILEGDDVASTIRSR